MKQNLFHLLPPEVLSYIILYIDIPSIGTLSQTSKAKCGSISDLVTSEETWFNIVNLRFNTFPPNKAYTSYRPKIYGGVTWKDAYRSMAQSNRIPKMRVLFKKKNVFAKGAGYLMQHDTYCNSCNDNHNHNDKYYGHGHGHGHGIENGNRNGKAVHKKQRQHQFVCAWVMINHTEDCNLRTTSLNVDGIRQRQFDMTGMTRHMMELREQRNHGNNNNNINNNRNTPYIELQLAFQNTKSGFSTVNVDISKTTVQMMCGEEDEGPILTQRIIRHGPLKPRIVYRSMGSQILFKEEKHRKKSSSRRSYTCSGSGSSSGSASYGSHGRNLYNHNNGHTNYGMNRNMNSSLISLRPFEFVIVSVNVPLTHYMEHAENIRYETDFLSRAISTCTPVSLHTSTESKNMSMSTSTCTSMGNMNTSMSTGAYTHTKEEKEEKEEVMGATTVASAVKQLANRLISSSLAVAMFSPEHEIWENYTQLPGNCLALVDRTSYPSV